MHDYDRTAASMSHLARILDGHSEALANELKAKATKYCGPDSKCQAKVEIKPGLMIVRLWLGLEPSDTKAEAQELAEILLGKDVTVEQHILPQAWEGVLMWVATLQVKLG